jgi:hypothetical protein
MLRKETQTLFTLILLLFITACGSRPAEDSSQATEIPPPEPTATAIVLEPTSLLTTVPDQPTATLVPTDTLQAASKLLVSAARSKGKPKLPVARPVIRIDWMGIVTGLLVRV